MATATKGATLAPLTLTLHSGPIDVVPVWRGVNLAVHAPHNETEARATGARWIVTHIASGMRAGATTNKARAIKAAKAWDGAFSASAGFSAEASRSWPHGDAWIAQLAGNAPIVTPTAVVSLPPVPVTGEPKAPPRPIVTASDGDGGEQLPVDPTIWPVIVNGAKRVRLSKVLPSGRSRLRDDRGRPVKMTGDIAAFKNPANPLLPILRLWFRDRWFDVPSMAEFHVWTFDSCCETPDGRTVEPDAEDSWLRLCGLV